MCLDIQATDVAKRVLNPSIVQHEVPLQTGTLLGRRLLVQVEVVEYDSYGDLRRSLSKLVSAVELGSILFSSGSKEDGLFSLAGRVITVPSPPLGFTTAHRFALTATFH